MGATTTTTYTVFDKPATTTDATGATTHITYNTQMQPVAITNADGHTWTYTYNLDGNITHQTDYNGIVTTNTTSPDGLITNVTTPAGTTTTTYNQLGLATSIDDASGTTLFDYDPFGRLTSITNPAATITYTRDTYGRATAETTRLASGEETRHTIELSATGMVTGEHLTLPAAGTITTGYGRNAAGEITSSTITQHTTPAVTHDHHTDTSAPAGLDHTGRLLAELTYTTNTRGHRATTAIDNLVRTQHTDVRGRITSDHTNLLDSATSGGLAPVAGRDFTWQADSTLTAITDELRGTTSFTVDAIGRATSATRTPHTNHSNPSDQGTTPPHTPTHTPARAGTPAPSGSATGGSAQENYSFTPAGVLASTADGVIDYHNTLPVKVGRTTYTYDAAGRITRTVTKRLGKKPLVHHFFYATGEQPIGFTSSDEPNTGYRYAYDGLGRRVAKDTINTTTGEVTHRDVFTHTGNQLAAVTTTIDTTDPARVGEGYVWTTDPATGATHGQIALTTSSTNGTGGTSDANDTPANPAAGWSQARVDATFYALVCDLAGSPQELINTTTGVVEGHTAQTLYGKRTWAGRCTSPLLFAGQYEDAESGWAYNRFRYYNPTLGAYNAQDPLGLAPRLASAQGYVDHAAFWVDVLGLASHVVSTNELRIAGVPETDIPLVRDWLNGVPTRDAGKAGAKPSLWNSSDAAFYTYENPITGPTAYSGMTNDLASRANNHADRFNALGVESRMQPASVDASKLSNGADSFNRRQCRAFEQLSIEHNGLHNLSNARNEIGTSTTNRQRIKNGALTWAQHMVDNGAIISDAL